MAAAANDDGEDDYYFYWKYCTFIDVASLQAYDIQGLMFIV